MFVLLNWLHPLFEAADKGGAGGGEQPTNEPTGEQQPAGSDGANGRGAPAGEGEELDATSLLKDAPVIDPRTGEPIDQSTEKEKSGEPGKSAEGESAKQPEQKEQSASGRDSQKFKLDDQEYTLEQIREWKKDSENKAEWQKRLTQESQLDNFMRSLQPEVKDAFITRAIADVYAKKDPSEYLKEGEETPITLTFEDDYGEEAEQVIEPGSEHYKALENHFEEIFLKKYQPAFAELKTHKEQLQQFEDERQRFYTEASQQYYIGFLKEHPEIGIPVSDGMDLMKTMQEALAAGPTHPLYRNSYKFARMIIDSRNAGMKITDWYEMMYGDFQTKKANAQKITETDRKNQKAVVPEPPGKGTSGADFIDRLKQSGGIGHDDLVAEFDRGKK